MYEIVEVSINAEKKVGVFYKQPFLNPFDAVLIIESLERVSDSEDLFVIDMFLDITKLQNDSEYMGQESVFLIRKK